MNSATAAKAPSSKETMAARESRHFRFWERHSITLQVGIAHDRVGVNRSVARVAEPQPQTRQFAPGWRHQGKSKVRVIEHGFPAPDDLGLVADVRAGDREYRDDGQQGP